ncbi:AMP-binding protein [Streptomyces sp. NPDC085540]|uniref:non-ribosomal peptide synthetase n=1 Tax=Streptomyces sp. NPDC085540 TaxID=3365730 RepID=UPI0037D8DB5A
MSHETLLARWNEHITRRGDSCAVSAPDRTWTHRELADQVAGLHRLLTSADSGEAGQAGGAVLVVCADPVRAAVALLACVAAGRTVAPVDVRQPAARWAAVLEDLRPACVVADEAGAEALTAAGVAGIAVLRADECAPGSWSGQHLEPAALTDAGYVYFTSGTTGRPKGIRGSLTAVAHFVDWESAEFRVGEGTRVSLLTSPGFDAFLRDLLVPLCAGGTVCVAPTPGLPVGDALVRWLAEQRVEVLHCVPTVFRTLRNAGAHAGALPDLRVALLAGEPVRASDVVWWRELFGDSKELVNLYGPSETTMTKVFRRLDSSDASADPVPAGRAMPGVTVRVLVAGAPATDAIGEVEIEVPFALPGYLGTDEGGFRPPNRYRTGDLGRIDADGTLVLLGRRDQQVKVAGVRVELGAVEEALRDHPAVHDACAVTADHDGDTVLGVYVVADASAGDDELRGHAALRLPAGQLPSVLVRLSAIPRTLSGKVDRRALPPLAAVRAATDEDLPRTPLEQEIAALWSELLHLPSVGRLDDFALLGGTSLAMARLLDALRTRFSAEVALRAFLLDPTVAGLATAVEDARAGRPAPLTKEASA